jgi:hypothetical protein
MAVIVVPAGKFTGTGLLLPVSARASTLRLAAARGCVSGGCCYMPRPTDVHMRRCTALASRHGTHRRRSRRNDGTSRRAVVPRADFIGRPLRRRKLLKSRVPPAMVAAPTTFAAAVAPRRSGRMASWTEHDRASLAAAWGRRHWQARWGAGLAATGAARAVASPQDSSWETPRTHQPTSTMALHRSALPCGDCPDSEGLCPRRAGRLAGCFVSRLAFTTRAKGGTTCILASRTRSFGFRAMPA